MSPWSEFGARGARPAAAAAGQTHPGRPAAAAAAGQTHPGSRWWITGAILVSVLHLPPGSSNSSRFSAYASKIRNYMRLIITYDDTRGGHRGGVDEC